MSPYRCDCADGWVRKTPLTIDSEGGYVMIPCPSCGGSGTVEACASCGLPLVPLEDEFGVINPSADHCALCNAQATDEEILHESEDEPPDFFDEEPDLDADYELEVIRATNSYERWLDRCAS